MEATPPIALAAAGGAAQAGQAPSPAAAAEARRVAEEFESFFVSHMLESMFSTIGVDPVFGGGQGETVYRSLLLQEYGKVAARRGGFGIADAVQREMLRLQENPT